MNIVQGTVAEYFMPLTQAWSKAKVTYRNLQEWWKVMRCGHMWFYSSDRKSRWCFRCTHVQFTCTRFP